MTCMNLGICGQSHTDYEIVGQRVRGSFRTALRRFGFNTAQIDQVIDDLDCDREMIIEERGYRFHIRPM